MYYHTSKEGYQVDGTCLMLFCNMKMLKMQQSIHQNSNIHGKVGSKQEFNGEKIKIKTGMGIALYIGIKK